MPYPTGYGTYRKPLTISLKRQRHSRQFATKIQKKKKRNSHNCIFNLENMTR